MTPDQELAYLAAFIDGEGWIMFRPTEKGKKALRHIGFNNTDKELFDSVCSMFRRAGFEIQIGFTKSKNPKHADRWSAKLRGGRPAAERFKELIPLQHNGKLNRLTAMIEYYNLVESQGRQRAKWATKDGYDERRAEISRETAIKRWAGHIYKSKRRYRVPTEGQRLQKNLKARQRRVAQSSTQ